MTRPIRLGVVVSHPIQYHAPLYRCLAHHPDIELSVLFLSDHGVRPTYDPGFGATFAYDVPLLDGYRYHFVRNVAPRHDVNSPFGLINPALWRDLARADCDVVLVHGYAHLSNWIAFISSKVHGIPFMIRGEARVDTARCQGGIRGWLRERSLRWLCESASVCLAIGALNEQFYVHHGVSPDRIVPAPYSVDNGLFRNAAERVRPHRAERIRGLGLDPALVTLVFAGKLQSWKRPQDALALARAEPEINLILVGDGPERTALEREAANLPNVSLTGFLNQSQIAEVFGLADGFVLPSSHEPWGLAVNESMAAGAVPFVSDRVGSGPDLVAGGPGGIYACGDVSALHTLVRDSLLEVPADMRSGLRRQVQKRVATHDIEATAAGIRHGAVKALGWR